MSYFSTALNRLSERNGFKQADLARESGLSRSHVSRLFNGDQKAIYDSDMAGLLRRRHCQAAKTYAKRPKPPFKNIWRAHDG